MFEWRDATAPYPGLRPFEAYEAEIFFGRETHTDRLLEILQRERFLAVIGPSGSGKSSLVRAGMLPAIAAGWLGTGSDWRLAIFRPGGEPIRRLAHALLQPGALGAELSTGDPATTAPANETPEDLPLIDAELRRGPLGLLHLVEDAQRRSARPQPFNLLVLVDQFEEIFRYTDRGATQSDEADAFVDLLLHARADERAHIFVALTMRTDFLGHCVRFLDLPEAINRAQYLTPRLTRTQMQDAIASPARVFGGEVVPEVVNELINQVALDFDQLPILQHALARMWERAVAIDPQSPVIRRHDLEETGGVTGALDRHAEAVFATLSGEQQVLAEHLFRSITERSRAGTSARDIRRPQILMQIANTAAPARPWRDFVPIIEAFAREGVNFLTHAQPLDENTVIDISHEALIRQWPRLQRWVDDEGDRAVEYRRWRDRVGQELLTGADLARAREWKAGTAAWQPTAGWAARYATGADPTKEFDETLEYVEQSQAAEAQRRRVEEQRRQREFEIEAARLRAEASAAEARAEAARARTRYFRYWLVGVACAFFVVAILAGYTWIEWREADFQRRRAERTLAESRFGKAVDRIQLDKRSRALAYLAAAMRLMRDYPSARGLTTSLLLDRTWPLPGVRPMHHDGRVRSVAVSPDGTRLLTASEDNTARLWDARSGAPIGKPMQHDGWVRTAVFSPDGHRIVTTSDDRTGDAPGTGGQARLWDAETAEPLPHAQPMRHTSIVTSAAFSPDGTRVVTASWDGTARLWDAASGAAQAVLMGHDKAVYSAEFSPDPDGARVLTASQDGTARLWDAASGAALGEPMRHRDAVYSAEFSPDGTRVVTASVDGSARLWDAASGAPLPHSESMHHDGAIFSATFSPDGTRIVTASSDRTARLWDGRSGAPLENSKPMRHDDTVNSAVFSRDGTRVATASDDGTGRVWDAFSGEPAGERMPHGGEVSAVAFSLDGSRVATASYDKKVRLWDARPGIALAERLSVPHVRSAAFTPDDGSRIVTVSTDGVQLWDARSMAPAGAPLKDNGKKMSFAAFSPDGSRIVTVAKDSVRLWNARSFEPVARLLGDVNGVGRAAISPDGTRVVTASQNGGAQLWDAHTGKPLEKAKPMRADVAINSAVFSPDGTRVVTASSDGTAHLWDAYSGEPLPDAEPMQHAKDVYTAAFSPDGKRVVTASRDGTARLWDADSGKRLGEPMQHEGPVNFASFSRDGTEVLTASDDRTARVWDGNSGSPLSEPLRHDGFVNTAVFSADGARILTASADETVRISTRPHLTTLDQADLARLAESISGFHIDDSGTLSSIGDDNQALVELQSKFEKSESSGDLGAVIRWLLADRDTRTISPFSTMTVREYRQRAARPAQPGE